MLSTPPLSSFLKVPQLILQIWDFESSATEFRNALYVLVYLRSSHSPSLELRAKTSQSIVKTMTYLLLFILTSHFFGKALHSMEYEWSLKISISTTPTSETNCRWQFPLIFMTKKKKHSPNIILKSETTPESSAGRHFTYDTMVSNNMKQMTST